MRPKYFARKVGELSNPPGPRGEPTWNSSRIAIYRQDNDSEEQIGEYVRNYGTLFRTFFPFRRKGRDFALYSRDYTATRVMALPSCQDIGGEERSGGGFCPVDFHVPCLDDATDSEEKRLFIDSGFVAGCVWGDDSCWKIQYLDLTNVEHGQIRRDERFGYIVLPQDLTLEQAVSTWTYDPQPDEPGQVISIAVERRFNILSGKDVSLEW
jgi:hypothetical protein